MEVTPSLVVGTFAVIRIGIGLAFAWAPDRLGGESAEGPGATLMTRSFAVRESVLGLGGLWALRTAKSSPGVLPMWAGLGALTDAGDVLVALGDRRRGRSGIMAALIATAGLVAELWAFSSSSR